MDLTHEISNRQNARTNRAKSPYINVIYPYQSLSFEVPITVTIQWDWSYFNTFYYPNVKIELYKNGNFNKLISSSALNNGNYSWVLENLSDGTTFQIKISVVGLDYIYGYSGIFSLTGNISPTWILTNFYYGPTIPYTNKEWILTNYKYPENTKDSNTNGTLLTNFSYPINDKDSNENSWILLTDGV